MNCGIISSCTQISVKKFVLLTCEIVRLLGGKVDYMYLPVIERKPKIFLTFLFSGQNVSMSVSCVVVVFLVIAISRHERRVSCKRFGKFPVEIPNRLKLSNFLRIHTSISNISRQKNKVERMNKMILSNLLNDKMPERSKSSHIRHYRQP